MPSFPAHGGHGLAGSKHASDDPVTSTPRVGNALSAFISNTQSGSRQQPTNTIATKDQIAAGAESSVTSAGMVSLNTDAKFAMEQNKALKKAVDEYAAKYQHSLSRAVGTTRRLLDHILHRVDQDGPFTQTETQAVKDLSSELDKLFATAKDAGSTYPMFMDKLKDSMGLYHTSMMNEAVQDNEQELALKQKKVNLQQSLIVEQRQSIEDCKEQSAKKLAEAADLQERVSRLTLDKGLLKSELDSYVVKLKEADGLHAKLSKNVEALEKELKTASVSKEKLTQETASLRTTKSNLEAELQQAERKITDHYEKELRDARESLKRESVKTAALEATLKSTKEDASNVQEQYARAQKELQDVQEKLKLQEDAYSKVFMQLEGEKQKGPSQDQLNMIMRRTSELQEQLSKVKTDCQNLEVKIKDLEKTNESLEDENNELAEKAKDYKKVYAAYTSLKEQQATMHASTPASSDGPGSLKKQAADIRALEEKIREVESEKAALNKKVEDWATLSTQTYEALQQASSPSPKEADRIRQESAAKDQVIEGLKNQLAPGPSRLKGGDLNGDAMYWKHKYETLLASIED